MKVISLSALCPQSGKDTLADFIESIEGINVKRIAFGDALRNEVIRLFNIIGSTFTAWEVCQMLLRPSKDVEHDAFSIKNLRLCPYRTFMMEQVGFNPIEITKPRSLRYHLQRYGNNYVKDHMNSPMYWIDTLQRQLEDWESEGDVDIVVITDTRAPEEFNVLTEEWDAHTFLIKRIDFPVSEHEVKREPHPIEEYAKNFKYDWELSNVYGDKSIMQADFINIFNNYI